MNNPLVTVRDLVHHLMEEKVLLTGVKPSVMNKNILCRMAQKNCVKAISTLYDYYKTPISEMKTLPAAFFEAVSEVCQICLLTYEEPIEVMQ